MADEITLDAPETRIERFLAAAAGMDGIPLDEPVTRIERYLYKIAQGSGGVPPVEDADKGKYLHANESTGALEWAEGGSGGGVLVVGVTISGSTATLDKTWQEIADARVSALIAYDSDGGAFVDWVSAYGGGEDGVYWVQFGGRDGKLPDFNASSASGYPSATMG